jgi:long-subunit fatty acid transport protein
VALPVELSFGVLGSPARGINLAVNAGWSGWAKAADDLLAAGEERSRDVWNVSVGTEFEAFRFGASRLPLRLGYRYRQLPFPVAGAALTETAVSGGLALDLAGGRTTVDLAFERGSRTAGVQRERFSSGFIGVTLRP